MKNTGNLAMTKVKVDETAWTGAGKLSAIECAETSLAVGQETTCTASYGPTTQADVDAARIDNTAVATGDAVRHPGVKSDPSSAQAVAPQAPGLHMVKTSETQEYTKAGEKIGYDFTVTNTGNVTMSNLKINETEFSGSGKLSAVECPVTVLAPGASTVCSATYTTTQADVDRGEITNAATATAKPPTEPEIETPETEVEIPAKQDPQLELVKDSEISDLKSGETTEPENPTGTPSTDLPREQAVTVDAPEMDEKKYVVGDKIDYTFTVTNTGNVTVKNVKVEELEFTGSGKLSELVCPEDLTLDPGESLTCTAQYTVTQADLDRGTVLNTAIAKGTDPTDKPVESNPDDAKEEGKQDPKLAIEKSVDKPRFKQGDKLVYTFEVTNTGNVTMTDVKVNETSFSGTGKLGKVNCPADAVKSLAPGAKVTCTAEYTATADDQAAQRPLSNSAEAEGKDPKGKPVVSPKDDASTTPDPLPEPRTPQAQTGNPLADTGDAGAPLLLLGAGGLLAASVALLVHRRMKKRGLAAAASEPADQ